MYEFTAQLAAVDRPPPPEALALFAGLVGNQAQIDGFFGVMAGSVSIADFYAPDNLADILGSAT